MEIECKSDSYSVNILHSVVGPNMPKQEIRETKLQGNLFGLKYILYIGPLPHESAYSVLINRISQQS